MYHPLEVRLSSEYSNQSRMQSGHAPSALRIVASEICSAISKYPVSSNNEEIATFPRSLNFRGIATICVATLSGPPSETLPFIGTKSLRLWWGSRNGAH